MATSKSCKLGIKFMENKFAPENHEYASSSTYTGFGCALCGKIQEGHKEHVERIPLEKKG